MIEEAAKIIAIQGSQLLIQAQPSSACGSCHARNACGQGLLSKYFNQTPGQLVINNRLDNGESLNVMVGDEVIIGIEEGSVLSGAFFAYLLPLMFVLVFALFAYVLDIQSEPLQMLITLVGLLLGIIIVKVILQGDKKHLKNMLPQLLRKSTTARKLSIQQDI